MLVNVEQRVVNPSVGTLLRLSDALGIQVQDGTVTVGPASRTEVSHG